MKFAPRFHRLFGGFPAVCYAEAEEFQAVRYVVTERGGILDALFEHAFAQLKDIEAFDCMVVFLWKDRTAAVWMDCWIQVISAGSAELQTRQVLTWAGLRDQPFSKEGPSIGADEPDYIVSQEQEYFARRAASGGSFEQFLSGEGPALPPGMIVPWDS